MNIIDKTERTVTFFIVLFLITSVSALDLNDIQIEELNSGFYIHYDLSANSQYLTGSIILNGANYFLNTNNKFLIKNLDCMQQYDIILRNATGGEILHQKTTKSDTPQIIRTNFKKDEINYIQQRILELSIEATKFSNFTFYLDSVQQDLRFNSENENNIKYQLILDDTTQEQELKIIANSCGKSSDEYILKFKVDKIKPTIVINHQINYSSNNVTFTIVPSEIGTLTITKNTITQTHEFDSTDPLKNDFSLNQLENNFVFSFSDKAGNSYQETKTINYDTEVGELVIDKLENTNRVFNYGSEEFRGKTDPYSKVKMYLLNEKKLKDICQEETSKCKYVSADNVESIEANINLNNNLILELDANLNYDIDEFARQNGYTLSKYNEGQAESSVYFLSKTSFDILELFTKSEATADSNGNFDFNMFLKSGENEYIVEVTDPSNNKLFKRYNITRLDASLIWRVEQRSDVTDLAIEHLDSTLPLEFIDNVVYTYIGGEDNAPNFNVLGGVRFERSIDDNDLIKDVTFKKIFQGEVDGEEKVFLRISIEFDKEKIKQKFNGDFEQDLFIKISNMNFFTGTDTESRVLLPRFNFHMKGYQGYLIPPEMAKDLAKKLTKVHNYTSEKVLPFLVKSITVSFGACLASSGLSFISEYGIKVSNKQLGCTPEQIENEENGCQNPANAYKNSMYICNRITCPKVPTLSESNILSTSEESIEFGQDFEVKSNTGFYALGEVDQIGDNNERYKYVISWNDGRKSETLTTEISKKQLCRYAYLNSTDCDAVFADDRKNELYISYMENLLIKSNEGYRPYSQKAPYFDQTKKLFNITTKKNVMMQNPYENIISSVETLCIPGIYSNINKYNTIIGEVASCFESLSETGADLSFCQQLLGYHICDGISALFNYVIPSEKANNVSDEMSINVETGLDGTGKFSTYLAKVASSKDKYSETNLNGLLEAGFGIGTSTNAQVNQICVAAIDYDWSTGNFFDFAVEGIIDNALATAQRETPPEVSAWGNVRQHASNIDGTIDLRYNIYLGAVNINSIKEISLTCHQFDKDNSNTHTACMGSTAEISVIKNFGVTQVTNSFDKIVSNSRYLYNAVKVKYYDESKDQDVEKFFKILDLTPQEFLQGFSCSISLGGIQCNTQYDAMILHVNKDNFFGSTSYTRTIPSNKIFIEDDLYLTFYLEDMKENVYLEVEYSDIFSTANSFKKYEYKLQHLGPEKGYYLVHLGKLTPPNNIGVVQQASAPYRIEGLNSINANDISYIRIEGYSEEEKFNFICDNCDNEFKDEKYSVEDLNNNKEILSIYSGKNLEVKTNVMPSIDKPKIILDMNHGPQKELSIKPTVKSSTYDITLSTMTIKWDLKRDTNNDDIGDSPYYEMKNGVLEQIGGNYNLNIMRKTRDESFIDLVYPIYRQARLPFNMLTKYYFVSLPMENSKINISTYKVVSGELSGAHQLFDSFSLKYDNNKYVVYTQGNPNTIESGKDDGVNYFSFKNDITASNEGYEVIMDIKSILDENIDSTGLQFPLSKNDNLDSELENYPFYFVSEENRRELN
ncbi:MAG: hypothetical protein PHT94_01850 [Candidatus Nanoarchaeia archaeon]|nr:hypothetical protein [Candidatus Nanoarchaeia archaeon]